jgi:hypothetical protein
MAGAKLPLIPSATDPRTARKLNSMWSGTVTHTQNVAVLPSHGDKLRNAEDAPDSEQLPRLSHLLIQARSRT